MMRLPLLLLACICANVSAQTQLEQLHEAQRILDKQLLAKDNEESRLRALELERSQLEKKKASLQESLSRNRHIYDDLVSTSKKLQHNLSRQGKLLAKLTMIGYIENRESPLKALFYVADKDRWQRNVAYRKYLTQDELATMLHTTVSLHSQQKLLTDLTNVSNIIDLQQKKLDTQLAKLDAIETRRLRTLRSLQAKIGKGKKKIALMQSLQNRLDSLASDIDELKTDELKISNFSALKGLLPLPTSGTIVSTLDESALAYGTSSLYNKGLLIATSYGSPVQAVASGTIVFSDWIRGFGLVIIIDHGEDYISLYAHNQQLLKKSGQWVRAGEIISHVGETGGQEEPRLYFELRHKSVSVNPRLWLAS